MGGLGGHMAHLSEDLELTFNSIVSILGNVASADIEAVTEKVDGQNLFLTVDESGELRAARNSGDIKSDMPLVEEQIDAPMIDMEAVLNRKKAQDNAAFSMIPTVGEFKGQRIYQGSPEMSSYLDSDAHSQYIKSKFNFQQGGLINYQDGGMIGPPVPPEMMGQAMNQQLGDSIDMRMANPQMGGALGMMRQESEAIEAAMKDNIARNARLALQKIKVDSLMQMEPQGMSIPDSLITNPQSLDNGFLRLLQEMNQSKGVRIPRPSTLR